MNEIESGPLRLDLWWACAGSFPPAPHKGVADQINMVIRLVSFAECHHRTVQSAEDFPGENQHVSFALHGSFSHAPEI